MSKYDPLNRFLLSRSGDDEAPMTFSEVERVLGFPLPRSARKFAAWWSNNTGAHVGVRAWRDAGFRAAQVDVPAERVTFVREATSVREPATPFLHKTAPAADREGDIRVPLESLSRATLRMVDDWMTETGLGRAEAVAALLDAAAIARRREMLEALPVARMPPGHDSTALIREDRDAR